MDKLPITNAFRHRVQLLRLNVDTQSSATGEDLESWFLVGNYWCQVTPLIGRELVNAREIVAECSHKIIMRVIGPVTTQDMFLFNGRVFGIGQVFRYDEMNSYYSIICHERMGQNPPIFQGIQLP